MYHAFAHFDQFKHFHQKLCVQVLIWTALDLLLVLLYTTAYLRDSLGWSLHLIYSEVSQGVSHSESGSHGSPGINQNNHKLLFYFTFSGWETNTWTSNMQFHYYCSHIQIYTRGLGKEGVTTSLVYLWACWFPGAGCCTGPAQTDTWRRCTDENLGKIFRPQCKNPFLNHSGYLN